MLAQGDSRHRMDQTGTIWRRFGRAGGRAIADWFRGAQWCVGTTTETHQLARLSASKRMNELVNRLPALRHLAPNCVHILVPCQSIKPRSRPAPKGDECRRWILMVGAIISGRGSCVREQCWSRLAPSRPPLGRVDGRYAVEPKVCIRREWRHSHCHRGSAGEHEPRVALGSPKQCREGALPGDSTAPPVSPQAAPPDTSPGYCGL